MGPGSVSPAAGGGSIRPRVLIAKPRRAAVAEARTLDALLAGIQELGFSPDEFFASLRQLELSAVAAVFGYLEFALEGERGSEALRFHLDLLSGVSPEDYSNWQNLLEQVRAREPLSADVRQFLEKGAVEDLLFQTALRYLGFEKVAELEPHPAQIAYLSSIITFLESWRSLATEDANVSLIFDAVNRYGSLQSYYSGHDLPRATIQRMLDEGYDTDYLVFGGQEILSAEAIQGRAPDWPARLEQLVTQAVGTETDPPRVNIGVDRFKFINQIKDDLDAVRAKQDKQAAIRILDQLIPILRTRQQLLARRRLLVDQSALDQYKYDLEQVRARLREPNNQPRPVQTLRAVRSRKLVPELFFDDTRLGSWLFKPGGIVHGEISRLLLDPATPLIEFWVDPYPEFLGVATLYPGLNSGKRRTILMDTLHYEDRLLDARGPQGTMQFLLEAMVADAYRAKAEKLLVFAAPWGKSLNFVEYVRTVEPRDNSIKYHESYSFESADPADGALANSLAGRHHYTQSFGYNQPMTGTIDYGYTVVQAGAIEKLAGDGRGVYEIDVAGFMEGQKLSRRVPRQEKAAPGSRGTVSRPTTQESREIKKREERAMAAAETAFRKVIPDLSFEILTEVDESLDRDLRDLHSQAFPAYPLPQPGHFTRRVVPKDAHVAVVRERATVIGFAVSLVNADVSPQALYVDVFAIAPRWQSMGLGTILLDAMVRLAAIRGFRAVYLLTRFGEDAIRIVRFYERAHFRVAGPYDGLGQLLFRPLSLAGPENALAIQEIVGRLLATLRPDIADARAMLRTALNPDTLELLQSIEETFPDAMQFGRQSLNRITLPDAHLIVVYGGEQLVAFGFCYQDPSLPRQILFADALRVRGEYGKAVATALIEAVLNIASLTCYTALVFDCDEHGRNALCSREYHEQFGAQVVDRRGRRVRMTIPLYSAEAAPPEQFAANDQTDKDLTHSNTEESVGIRRR